MSRIDNLIKNYISFVSVPWQENQAGPQRIIFAVYPQAEELRLQARMKEFKTETIQAGYKWGEFDLTDSFPSWLATQRYAESYFKQPELLTEGLLAKYLSFIVEEVGKEIMNCQLDNRTVFCISGVGSLFGLLRAKDVCESIVEQVPGRLLVMFPGTYSENNLRLLDAYDGWNYHGTVITTD